MRKIRIFEHTSLDGVIAPDKRNEGDDEFANGGWSTPYQSHNAYRQQGSVIGRGEISSNELVTARWTASTISRGLPFMVQCLLIPLAGTQPRLAACFANAICIEQQAVSLIEIDARLHKRLTAIDAQRVARIQVQRLCSPAGACSEQGSRMTRACVGQSTRQRFVDCQECRDERTLDRSLTQMHVQLLEQFCRPVVSEGCPQQCLDDGDNNGGGRPVSGGVRNEYSPTPRGSGPFVELHKVVQISTGLGKCFEAGCDL